MPKGSHLLYKIIIHNFMIFKLVTAMMIVILLKYHGDYVIIDGDHVIIDGDHVIIDGDHVIIDGDDDYVDDDHHQSYDGW